jgi:hypothetical protein
MYERLASRGAQGLISRGKPVTFEHLRSARRAPGWMYQRLERAAEAGFQNAENKT